MRLFTIENYLKYCKENNLKPGYYTSLKSFSIAVNGII